MLATLTRLFPLWAALRSGSPHWPMGHHLLMLIMFGMGVHLKLEDFNASCRVRRRSLRDISALSGDAARRRLLALLSYAAGAFRRMVLVGSVASGPPPT